MEREAALEPMARSLATSPPLTWSRFVGWLRGPKVSAQLALVLTVAATLSGLATYVVISGWLNVAAEPGLVLGLLYLDLILLLLLGAVAPAIIVAVFSVAFLHFGLEAWFSERISGALTNSLNVAQAYLEEHKEVIRADALLMAADLNREGPALIGDPEMFQRLLDAQAALRALTEAVGFLGNGQVVARSGLGFFLQLERVPPTAFGEAGHG